MLTLSYRGNLSLAHRVPKSPSKKTEKPISIHTALNKQMSVINGHTRQVRVGLVSYVMHNIARLSHMGQIDCSDFTQYWIYT